MRQLAGVMSLAVLAVVSSAVLAQDPTDPPSRVARLNYVDGSVSFRPGNLQEWAAATLNYPLTDGDRLWTEPEARAELHIGPTAIHVAEQTAFGILKLDDHLAQMSLAQGTVYLRIPRLDEDEVYEIDTPSGAIAIRQVGDYRFDVSDNGDSTLVTVRSGQAEVTGAVSRFTVRPGRTLRLSLTAAGEVIAEELQAEALDPWEEWCVGRDALAEYSTAASDAYVTPEMTGVEDLVGYGDWSVDQDYGAVWSPRGVDDDWAPYRNGHWVYVGAWGWTWIDDAPWGFAPFHFGRWVRTPHGWVWIPGPRGPHPVYAPALVTFVTGGARAIAWVPLGPREPFLPPYRATDAYLRRLNSGITGTPGRGLANRQYATAVSQADFTSARRVPGARVNANVPNGASPANLTDLRPGRESYLGRPVPPGAKTPTPPAATSNRRILGHDAQTQVVTRPAPPTIDRRQEAERQRADQQRQDDQRRQAEQQRADQDRQQQADQQRQEQTRRQDDQRRQEESRRQAEQQRADQDRQRQTEQQRQEESRRQAEQQRADQDRQQRQADQQRRAEQQRQDDQRRQSEQQRAEQDRQRQAEQQRQEESRRQADQQRAEQDRQRQADQQRQEESRRQADQQRAEQERQRQEAEKQRQEADKRAEEARKKQQ